ncbi:hypothetical protein QYE76_013499 [Lolium multiflorum]|uniref:Craniofacial development protein 2-like n=1 Tax=Lolium multiflorum TaxID=4521 RepID=A0AAD8U194_LOLMU|nr:hypothetical protein QYE76_013499 [Lolium multiflorum]
MAVRRRVDVLCVQKIKWKGQKAKEVDDTGFKLWYTGTTSNKNGVGILVNKSLRDGDVDIKRQGDRMILVKLVVGDLVLNVISVYVPQVGHNESTKREFWEGLEDLVMRVPIGDKLFIGGDLNGHVGTSNTGFERVHGGFGYGIRNQEGEDVMSFALAYDMESDVKEALRRMKGGKAMGPDGIPIEAWRRLGDIAILWPTNLFNLIFGSNKMP